MLNSTDINDSDIRDCFHRVNKDDLFTDEEKKRLEEVKQRKQEIKEEMFDVKRFGKKEYNRRYVRKRAEKQKELINGGNIC